MADSWTWLGDEELLAVLLDHEAETRRRYAEHLAMLEEARSRNLAGSLGYRDIGRLLTDVLRLDTKEATQRLTHTADLVASHAPSGAVVQPRLPRLAEAAAEGMVGRDHIHAVCAAVRALPPSASAEDRTVAEKVLTDTARLHEPRVITRLGRDILARADQDGTPPAERELASPSRELRLHARRTGRIALAGELDAEAGALLESLLSPLTKPRSAEANSGHADLRGLAERQGDALVEILETAAGSEDLPSAGGEPASITVTVDLEDLRQGPRQHTVDGAGGLTAAQARRMACDAGIIPAVLGTASEILDIGHKTRVVPAHIRRALALRDGGCTFPGCHRRPPQCHAHHLIHWADGGKTALGNLALVCSYHHKIVHHSAWDARTATDGHPEFVPPAYIDPDRTPRRNVLRQRSTGPPVPTRWRWSRHA